MFAARFFNFVHRRARRIGSAALLLSLMAAMVVATAGVADAGPIRDRQPVRVAEQPNPVEELRLACGVEIIDDERGVLCRWSASTHDHVRGYKLFRIVDGSARELVATVGAEERLHGFDVNIEAGNHLIYGVVAVNGNGRVVGIGGPVRLSIPG